METLLIIILLPFALASAYAVLLLFFGLVGMVIEPFVEIGEAAPGLITKDMVMIALAVLGAIALGTMFIEQFT